MALSYIKGLIAGVAVVFATQGYAMDEQIKVPQCLAKTFGQTYPVLAKNKEFKILSVPSEALDSIARLADKQRCGRFVNVTHQLHKKSARELLAPAKKHALLTAPAVYEIKHQAEVNAAIATVESDNIWQTLVHLTDFYNRSATKQSGVDVAHWLQSQFNDMANAAGRQDVDSWFVDTGYYIQPSLVTVIGKNLPGAAVVVGAHMDTLDGRMPGAGDDGSGSSSVMEAARVLLNQKSLNHPVYIIWYAAEERGLVGSQYVVQDFLDKGIQVKAVVQFDMTGFRNDPDDQTMWVFRDYVDRNLSDYVVKLIKTYINVPVDFSRCYYGCSDHASWTEEGFPAAFPCETSFDDHNPYIHSSADTLELMSKEHMTNFSKLAVAFAMELALD